MKKQFSKKDLEKIVGGKIPELQPGEPYFATISACFFVVSIKKGDYQAAKDLYKKIEEHGDEEFFNAFKEMVQFLGVNINDYVN